MNARMSAQMQQTLLESRLNVAAITALVAQGENVDARDMNGRTALFIAASRPNAALCRALLAGGANVNVTDNDGQTPLMWAAEQKGNRQVVRMLIDAGADVNARAVDG
jgi:uncharacterized protein